MRLNATLAIFTAVAFQANAAEDMGSYEIVALDRAEFPRYDGGWNPGSGAEVEFSGWKFFREGVEILTGDTEIFSMPDAGNDAGWVGGAKRFFSVKSEGETPSYAQRTLNQKIWENDMLSATLLLAGTAGEAGMVIGRRDEDNGVAAIVAVVRDGERLVVLDGEGEKEIDMGAGGGPIGVSFVFAADGTYTLQANEVKKDGKIVDIGPRKARGGGVPGVYTLGFFSKGGAEVGFDDLQVERVVR